MLSPREAKTRTITKGRSDLLFFILLCGLLTFFKINFFQNFRNTIRVSNGLDPDQESVSPGLVSNCLQRYPTEMPNEISL